MPRIFTLLFFIVLSFAANCQTADFTYQGSNGLYCAPASVQFTQTSSGTPIGFLWDFGNGASSTNPNPAVGYTNAGTYTVTLLVIYEQTSVTITKQIVINPSITAAITYDRSYICIPGPVTLTGVSDGNIVSYEWDFNDGSPVVITGAASATHNYMAYGSYFATLKVTDISGCFATATLHIAVERPQLTTSVAPVSGCIPASVTFSATALLPTSASVTGYTWDFGDGSPTLTTTTNTSTHVYNAVGNYLPVINIITNEGCSNTKNYPAVAYGTPPTNHVAYPKRLVICGSETAEFVSKAVTANTYTWDFGDGTIITFSDTLAQHKYATLGTKNITVTPFFNGCAGTPVTMTIDVVGVIAGYTYANTCSSPKRYLFTNTSQGNLSSILWNFGDGSPTVNTVNAIHNFPPTGTFLTALTVTDIITGCADTYTKEIYTANPALVNPDTSICKNTNTAFSIQDNYNNPAATYTWNVAGMVIGPVSTANLTINANLLGNFTNNYVVINNGAESCPDTIQLSKPLLVKGPNIGFTSPNSICFKSPYGVINTTQPYIPGDTITSWYWTFGIAHDSVYQPLPFSDFVYPGTWDIQLDAVDVNGCRDTLHKVLTVNPIPFLHSIPGTDTLCLGQTDTLIAFHSDNILWSPAGLLSCATCDTVIANPTVSTDFYVSSTNSFNCTVTDTVHVKVYSPFTAVANPANIYVCANEQVQLNVSPALKTVSWSPPTGLSNPGIYNPVITSPAGNTTYTALLADSAGCFSSSAKVNVYVKSTPVVNAGPDMTYPYNAPFLLSPTYSANVNTYLWSPSERLDCINCPSPNGIAAVTETYTITVTSDSGCIGKDVITIFVECKTANLLLPTAFTPNNDNLNDYYYPITRGIKTIRRFAVFNRRGQLVFEAKDFLPNNRTSGWDGRFKGMPESSGAYVYFLEAVCEAGATLTRKGSFVLIR